MPSEAATLLLRERRSSLKQQIYNLSPGIKRLNSRVEKDLEKHDNYWKQADPEFWQTEYSLKNHSAMVLKVSLAMGEKRGVTDAEKATMAAAAQYHDCGKVREVCHLYRLGRKLTRLEKRQVNKHAELSAQYIQEGMSIIRKEDRKFLKRVVKIVRWHHKPWRVLNRWDRLLAWDLWLADTYVAMLENRHLAGRSQVKALEELPHIIKENAPLLARLVYGREINQSLKILTELYGLKPSIIV
jgi:hypothetical protein